MQPDDTFLEHSLDEAARSDAAGCVVAVPAPDASVEAFLALALDGPATLWHPAEGVALAGRGAAVVCAGSSLAALRDEASRALTSLRVFVHPARASYTPKLFGGQRFDPSRTHADDPAWRAFPAAAMILPRWSLSREADGPTLALALTREECARAPAVLPAVRAVLAALAAPAGAIPPRVSAALDRDEGRDAWSALVHNALAVMREGRAQKLVAARRSEARAAAPWHLARVLHDLADAAAPGCVRFAMQHGDTVLVGATPERLVARRDDLVTLDALAGSMPRGCDADDDAARAQALAVSDKDLREHALVVDGARASLAPFTTSIEASASPSVRTLRNVHHLWTPMRATLRDGAHVLSLVGALHPTPALGGAPRAEALAWIAAREPHPRGWYAGPIGWCDARGDGEFFVAIRSAVVRGDRAWVYAGAGLVEGSDVDAEWRETDAKMSVMRAALGV